MNGAPEPAAGRYLLSRYAEAMFWLARYMERIENLARLLDVTETFMRTGGGGSGWRSIVQINADEERFFAGAERADHDSVVRFYVLDRENPTSIMASIAAAHENARTLRPLISTEMWTQINVFHRELRALTPADTTPARLSRLCDRLKQSCQTHAGITSGTLFRDQAWNFYTLGRFLERADQTTRLVDIKYHTLLPSAHDVGTAIDISQWHALLRSAAGYHAFRRVYPSGMTPAAVAGFLLMNHSFPRSLVLCVEQLREQLGQLRSGHGLRATEAEEIIDDLRAALLAQSIEAVIGRGLHEFLDWVQRRLINTHGAIADAFWRAPAPPPGESAPEPAEAQRQG